MTTTKTATAYQLAEQLAATVRTSLLYRWTALAVDGQHFGFEQDPYDHPGGAAVLFTATVGDLEASVALNISPRLKYAQAEPYEGWTVEGHTGFNGRCFTRRGLDCASVWLTSDEIAERGPNTYTGIVALLGNELNRCAAAHARTKSAVPVPGLPFNVQPSWFAESAARLKAGKSVTLSPHGMGVGYVLTTVRRRGAMRADGQLEAKLGLLKAVYVEPYDHD